MDSSFFRRQGPGILLVAACVFPLAVILAWQAALTNANLPADWIPEKFAETREYAWYFRHFGHDEILVVSWPGCTVDDPRLDQVLDLTLDGTDGAVSDAATGTSPVASGPALSSHVRYFRKGYTGRRALAELTTGDLQLTRDEALDRLSGWLVGPDRESTCAVLTVNQQGDLHRADAVQAAVTAAVAAGVPAEEVRLGGPTYDGVAIDAESNRSLFLLTGLAILAGLILTWWFLGSFQLMLMVFFTSTFCQCLSLAAVQLAGSNMDSVLIMMPALVYVLTISGAIHLLNYYVETLHNEGRQGAVWRAVQHSWVPCSMASITTAIGLASLTVSDIVPVRKFGFFSALGVIISLVLLFTYLPALLEWWPLRIHHNRRLHSEDEEVPWGQWFADFGIKYRLPVMLCAVALMAFFGLGALRVQSSVKLLEMFQPSSKTLQDYTWLEERLGPLMPVEVTLDFGPAGDAPQLIGLNEPLVGDWLHKGSNGAPPSAMGTLKRLELVEALRAELAAMPEVGGSVSLGTFLPSIPPPTLRQIAERREYARELQANHESLMASGFYALDRGHELFHISLRVPALSDHDYAELVDQLQAKVDAFIASYPASKLDGVTPQPLVCGGVPLVSLVQRRLLDNLMSSFTVAFVSIFATIMLATWSFPAGILAMPPNVFPTLVILGSMGWLGIKVDLGSMLTVSVALGIAVDNELHFFTRFREGLERGFSRGDAIRLAFRQCAGAMVKSALICGIGLSIFVLSPFVPTARFGWLMCVLLLAAMVGDLFILPALLMGPIGRWFEWGVRRKQNGRQLAERLSVCDAGLATPPVDLEVKMAELNLSEPGA